jgi:hypothetical protein
MTNYEKLGGAFLFGLACLVLSIFLAAGIVGVAAVNFGAPVWMGWGISIGVIGYCVSILARYAE